MRGLQYSNEHYAARETTVPVRGLPRAGEPHLLDFGADAVQRNFKGLDECAQVGAAQAPQVAGGGYLASSVRGN
jgi:hypothetical protein